MTTSVEASSAVADLRDERPVERRILAPVCTAFGTLAACGYLALVDPNEPGHYPLCPLRAVLGWDCPGCGGLRGMHALLTGDPLRALDHNLLLVFVVPLAVWLWARWFLRSWRGVSPPVTDRQQRRWTRFTVAVLVLAIAFGVLRNFVPYLGSTA